MANETHQYGPWQPWQPRAVAELFSTLTVPWWIAGGWAIDLLIGEETREHDDIDVQILRRDQQAVRALLDGWDIQAALPPPRDETWPFREWRSDTLLDLAVHDIWCRPHKTAPWAIQLMIADTNDDQWLFRRDNRISCPLTAIGHQTGDGLPYLAPAIQLLYKAKKPRPKDEADFASVLPHLDQESRQWLAQALAIVHPHHAWITLLERY